jgi:hypothetical protein
MQRIKKIISHLFDKDFLVDYLSTKFSKFYSDEKYLRLKYSLRFKKELNLQEPKGFNEKLNWMKLNFRNPIFTMMADKYWVKQYVADKIGSEYIVPCYGCWSRVEDINFDALPDRFFLKSTHDSGGGIFVDKKVGLDMNRIRKRFNKKTLRGKNWYWYLREFPYKNIEPRIIAEEYLDEGTGHELHDYKFYCFKGEPRFMYITNKGKKIYENFYDLNFNPVDISHGYERVIPEFSRPENFEKMIELARILSAGLPFIRIDFFNVNQKLYFGEFTFYDWGGMKPLNEQWESELGNMIELNMKDWLGTTK